MKRDEWIKHVLFKVMCVEADSANLDKFTRQLNFCWDYALTLLTRRATTDLTTILTPVEETIGATIGSSLGFAVADFVVEPVVNAMLPPVAAAAVSVATPCLIGVAGAIACEGWKNKGHTKIYEKLHEEKVTAENPTPRDQSGMRYLGSPEHTSLLITLTKALASKAGHERNLAAVLDNQCRMIRLQKFGRSVVGVAGAAMGGGLLTGAMTTTYGKQVLFSIVGGAAYGATVAAHDARTASQKSQHVTDTRNDHQELESVPQSGLRQRKGH